MKRLATIILALGIMGNLFAQDIILMKKNHEEITARVIEVTDYTVEYKRYSDLEGASFLVKTIDVDTIFYENGDKQYFVLADDEEVELTKEVEIQDQQSQYAGYQEDITDNVTRTYEIEQKGLYKSNRGPEFQCILNMGMNFTADHIGPTFDASFGVRGRDWFYVGLGLSFGSLISPYNTSYYDAAVSYNTYFHLRFYIPARWNVMPFFDGAVGFQVASTDGCSAYRDLYAHLGFGIEFDWFELSMGYNHGCSAIGYDYETELYNIYKHNGYFKIGFAF